MVAARLPPSGVHCGFREGELGGAVQHLDRLVAVSETPEWAIDYADNVLVAPVHPDVRDGSLTDAARLIVLHDQRAVDVERRVGSTALRHPIDAPQRLTTHAGDDRRVTCVGEAAAGLLQAKEHLAMPTPPPATNH